MFVCEREREREKILLSSIFLSNNYLQNLQELTPTLEFKGREKNNRH